MSQKQIKKLRKRFIELKGRSPQKTIFDIHQRVVESDEFRQVKKQIKQLKQIHGVKLSPTDIRRIKEKIM
jgi:hypothetical protein